MVARELIRLMEEEILLKRPHAVSDPGHRLPDLLLVDSPELRVVAAKSEDVFVVVLLLIAEAVTKRTDSRRGREELVAANVIVELIDVAEESANLVATLGMRVVVVEVREQRGTPEVAEHHHHAVERRKWSAFRRLHYPIVTVKLW